MATKKSENDSQYDIQSDSTRKKYPDSSRVKDDISQLKSLNVKKNDPGEGAEYVRRTLKAKEDTLSSMRKKK